MHKLLQMLMKTRKTDVSDLYAAEWELHATDEQLSDGFRQHTATQTYSIPTDESSKSVSQVHKHKPGTVLSFNTTAQ